MLRKKTRIKAIVIGSETVDLLFISLLTVVFVFSVVFTVKNTFKGKKNDFLLYNVSRALTIVGASNPKDDMLYVVQNICGIGNHISNFSSIPYFFGNSEKSEAPQTDATVEPKTDEYSQAKTVTKNYADKNLQIKNETLYNIDVNSLLASKLGLKFDFKQPEILIVHTHGTESYTQSEKYKYSDNERARCTDKSYNMIRVGEELKKELEKHGFKVVHDTTLNDYPSYNSSYEKTLGVIENNLKKYPSIKCVFDVHRDAIETEDGTRIKLTSQINGEKVSQVMIVCGTDGLGLSHPNWMNNLSLALKLQSHFNEKYPDFMRPLNLRKERFNMHKTSGSLIFEIGTHGNTLDESINSCKYLAKGIAAVLKEGI